MEIDDDTHEDKLAVTTDDLLDTMRNRVMNIPEIRKHVFTFLPLDSIKTCRRVCREWNATAEALLLAMSRIRFYNNRYDPEQARLPDRFIDEFKTGSLLNKCNKFCFNSPESSIDYEDLNNFIEQFGSDMKELTMFCINIRSVLYRLSRKDLIDLVPPNLTKLEVITEHESSTHLTISMKRLKNLKTLRLGGCTLKITDGVSCAPAELRMKNVFFLRNRKDYQSLVTLNNLFDLRNLKVLQLDCNDTENIEVDLSDGALALKELVLHRVRVTNWESSTWTVERLILGKKMKFSTATGMKFEELTFSGPILDVAALPAALKSLSIQRLTTKLLRIECARNLANLKYLILHRKEYSVLQYFQTCANLTHLQLIPIDEDDAELATIDVSLLPKTIKVLRLTYDCELVGKIDFEIETLIVEHIPFGDAYDFIIENLTIKNAFFYCSNFEFVTDDGAGIQRVVAELELMLDRCIVGPFLLPGTDRLSFSLFVHFNENPKAEYLVKTCKDGDLIQKVVDKKEIDRLKELWWTDDVISF